MTDAKLLEPDFLSVGGVAERLSVAPSSVYGWLAMGQLPHHRFGRAIRVHRRDVDAFIASARADRFRNRPLYATPSTR